MGALQSCCNDCFGGSGNTGGGVAAAGSQNSYQTISGHQSGGRVQPQPQGPQPDPEEKRRQLAEAAEKRRQADLHRGVKDVESVKRQQKRHDEVERREEEAARMGVDNQPVLRWQAS